MAEPSSVKYSTLIGTLATPLLAIEMVTEPFPSLTVYSGSEKPMAITRNKENCNKKIIMHPIIVSVDVFVCIGTYDHCP